MDSAATAAARCEPWLGREGLAVVAFWFDDGLNADESAARAEAL